MKNQIYAVIVCLLMLSLGAKAQKKQATGIRFEENHTEALAKVMKNKQKPDLVFVYCYQDGNPACAKMGNLVLKTRQVSDFINQHFVSARIDAGQAGNKAFMERYPMSVLPSFLVLDKTGEEVGRFCGVAEPDVFLEKMRYAMDPAHSVKAKLAAYKQEKTTARANECLEAYYQAGRISEMVKFLESIYYVYMPEERYSVEMWKYVAPALMNTTSPIFSVFIREKYLANQSLGKSIVDEALSKSLRQYAFWYVSGKLKADDRSAALYISYLGLIDDQDLASHYIMVACQLYMQRAFDGRAYESILNYLSAEKVCALPEKDRAFVERFFMNINEMPQELIERYKKDRDAYFKKQLEQAGA